MKKLLLILMLLAGCACTKCEETGYVINGCFGYICDCPLGDKHREDLYKKE